MTHEELAEMIPAYALDALTEHERRSVAKHLPYCQACQRALRESQRVTQLLPLAVEEREPPVGLRARVLTAARREGAPRQLLPLAAWRWRPRARWRLAELVAAAAVLLAVVLGAWNVGLQSDLARLRGQVWTGRGTERAPAATAELSYFPAKQATLVYVKGLPALPPGRVYELWVFQDGRPIARGTPPLSPAGELRAVLSDNPKDLEQFAVTEEAAPGGPQPGGPIVLVAKIRR